MTKPTDAWISLRSADLEAAIDPLGAQLSILRDASGRDLLWDGDPAVWNGRAPILFPIVGMLAGGQYRLGDRRYTLGRHGFARRSLFSVATHTATTAAFRLVHSPETFAVYPFQFELEVMFQLEGPTLAVTSWVRNTAEVPLPASLGYHPALRWPLPGGETRAAHFIEFEQDEPEPLRRLDDNGLLQRESIPSPVQGRRLTLADELFTHDALIFDHVRSRSVTYGSEVGPRIEVAFPGVPFLGIWSKPGAQFVCIEPWQGVTDEAGYAGDLYGRVGGFVVPPGGVHSVGMSITLIP